MLLITEVFPELQYPSTGKRHAVKRPFPNISGQSKQTTDTIEKMAHSANMYVDSMTYDKPKALSIREAAIIVYMRYTYAKNDAPRVRSKLVKPFRKPTKLWRAYLERS